MCLLHSGSKGLHIGRFMLEAEQWKRRKNCSVSSPKAHPSSCSAGYDMSCPSFAHFLLLVLITLLLSALTILITLLLSILSVLIALLLHTLSVLITLLLNTLCVLITLPLSIMSSIPTLIFRRFFGGFFPLFFRAASPDKRTCCNSPTVPLTPKFCPIVACLWSLMIRRRDSWATG
jgi:hypothetical protein